MLLVIVIKLPALVYKVWVFTKEGCLLIVKLAQCCANNIFLKLGIIGES
jgi:hypothetical protein